ncbi:MAG: FAD-dependent oxidoreductase [Desulfuromonadaceae bacterium]|nr:FAD-dependent oxidoreductase [Desulfuromonadaceae bacterium]
MERITFALDGKKLTVAKGTTILEAARAEGIFIPTFCHNEKLKPFASCFVCVVEIAGRAGLVPSCSTMAAEGMTVVTDSERIRKARRTCVELLLSDHEGDCLGPCMTTCPAGIDIPGFVKHLAEGNDRAALELIKRNMPLPAVLGRICTRPCEGECRRKLVEEPIAICQLHRFAADRVSASGVEYIPRKAPSSGKRVAVVGAGPAGLSAAYYLHLLGHRCTVFDMHEKAGGMTRYGIPSYRLPREVIEREVAVIKELGAEFRFNTRLGVDITLDRLCADFDAVFLGLGAQLAKPMSIRGEETEGVLSGIGFLGASSRDESLKIGRRVMVVGGGNTAVDAARTALRLGAGEVSILYRRTRAEMPAWEEEIHAAEKEGVRLDILAAPVAIDQGPDGFLHVTCIEMELGEPDASGRRRPIPKPGSEHLRVVDNVIAAIGQDVDASDCSGLRLTKWQTIDADLHRGTTNIDKIFAGGDCVSGADIAVTAVAAGRRAAVSIDQYLRGEKVTGEPVLYNHTMGRITEVDSRVAEGFDKVPRAAMPEREVEERIRGFAEVETGFSEAAVRQEAARCMECGCRDVNECRLRSYATEFHADQFHYRGLKRVYERDDSHAEVVYDAHKCIQCGNCVRLSEEILGTSAVGFTGRGISARVRPAMGRPLAEVDGKGIDQLVENCPVGALIRKDDRVAALEPEFKRPEPPHPE